MSKIPTSLVRGGTALARRAYSDVTAANGRPQSLPVTASGDRTLTFNDNGPGSEDTIVASSGDFTTEHFNVGQIIEIYGTTNNNAIRGQIKTVTATVITLVEKGILTQEGALSTTATIRGSQAGIPTQNARFVHISIFCKDSGGTLDWSFWVKNAQTGLWSLDTRFGTDGDGVETVTGANADNPNWDVAETVGADFVFLQFSNPVSLTNGVDAWLLGCTF